MGQCTGGQLEAANYLHAATTVFLLLYDSRTASWLPQPDQVLYGMTICFWTIKNNLKGAGTACSWPGRLVSHVTTWLKEGGAASNKPENQEILESSMELLRQSLTTARCGCYRLVRENLVADRIFSSAMVAASHRGIRISAIHLRTNHYYGFSTKCSRWSPCIAPSKREGRATTVPTSIAGPYNRFHTSFERRYSQQRDVSWGYRGL